MKTFNEFVFPQADLLQIEWIGFPDCRLRGWLRRFLWPSGFRAANVYCIRLWLIRITIRWPWHPWAAYSEGWDDCWRQEHGLPTYRQLYEAEKKQQDGGGGDE
jgi:hypothetical protein